MKQYQLNESTHPLGNMQLIWLSRILEMDLTPSQVGQLVNDILVDVELVPLKNCLRPTYRLSRFDDPESVLFVRNIISGCVSIRRVSPKKMICWLEYPEVFLNVFCSWHTRHSCKNIHSEITKIQFDFHLLSRRKHSLVYT